jgi:hypothetical protein
MCRLSRCTVPNSDFPPLSPFRPSSGVSSSAALRVAFLRDVLLMIAAGWVSGVVVYVESWERSANGRVVMLNIEAGCRFRVRVNREDVPAMQMARHNESSFS